MCRGSGVSGGGRRSLCRPQFGPNSLLSSTKNICEQKSWSGSRVPHVSLCVVVLGANSLLRSTKNRVKIFVSKNLSLSVLVKSWPSSTKQWSPNICEQKVRILKVLVGPTSRVPHPSLFQCFSQFYAEKWAPPQIRYTCEKIWTAKIIQDIWEGTQYHWIKQMHSM